MRFFLLGLFFLSGQVYGQDLQVAGRVYTDQYLFTHPESTQPAFVQSSYSAWLELDRNFGPQFRLHVVNQLDTFLRDLNHPDHASAHDQLREAYLAYTDDSHDLRIGQQIIPWGKSDGINPTDYFTAKDYTSLNPDDEVKRRGAFALNWNYTPNNGLSPLTFQTVIQAWYPQTRFILPSSVVPDGLKVERYPPSPGAFHSDSFEYGFKMAYLKAAFDWSVSFFHGFNQFPEYIFDPRDFSVKAINPEENAVGTDGSFTVGNSIIRFESALHFPTNGSAQDPLFGLVEPSHWDSVLGIERPIGSDFRIQVQALYRWHLYYADSNRQSSTNPVIDQIQQGIARANQTLLNYRKRANPGATFRFSYAKDTSDWNADLFLVGYFSEGQDFLLRPQASYRPRQNLKLIAGIDFYGGDPSGPLGALHRQSDAFFEAKYSF